MLEKMLIGLHTTVFNEPAKDFSMAVSFYREAAT